MATRITNKEMSDLIASMGITDSKAKQIFESFMNEKFEECRNEARAEAFTAMKKQAEEDKKKLVESLTFITNQTIAEEKKKFDVHRKSLINEKLNLNKQQQSISAELADKKAELTESYQKKLDEARAKYSSDLANVKEEAKKLVESNKAAMARSVKNFVDKVITEEVNKSRAKTRQLNTAVKELDKFITEQVHNIVKSQREEMKNYDKMKVDFANQTKAEYAKAHKNFVTESTSKISKFIKESIENEIRAMRNEIRQYKKETFGRELFEAFQAEYAKRFFNENKFTSQLAKSSSRKQRQYKELAESAEKKVQELTQQVKSLTEAKEIAIRDKIITESASILPTDKRNMLKSLVKDVPTAQLQNKINSYIPLIMKENSNSTINSSRNEKILSEGKSRVVTGDSNRMYKQAINNRVTSDAEDLINEIINI